MANEERIAKEIFKQYGLDFHTFKRSESGWTNAVWLNNDFALRLSLTKDSDRIRREVELSKLLPVEIGYPENIMTGVNDGYEWSLSKKIPGRVLSEVWVSLKWDERFLAVKQIIDIVNHIHSIDVNKAEFLTKKTAWYNEFSKEDSISGIENYVRQKFLTVEQGRQMNKILNSFYGKHFTSKPVLNHGDITMDNILWHDGNIVSLMDFEHAVIAPPELDVRSLVNLVLLKEDDKILTRDDSIEIHEYLDGVLELLKPMCSRSESNDLILGYSILFWQRFFEFWLEEPDGDIKQCGAYVRLCSLINGDKGYLSYIL
jgi:scyllo-inosamine 4-kinase